LKNPKKRMHNKLKFKGCKITMLTLIKESWSICSRGWPSKPLMGGEDFGPFECSMLQYRGMPGPGMGVGGLRSRGRGEGIGDFRRGN
jgi:hypothetical protein